jgi:glc operon protein GlcG
MCLSWQSAYAQKYLVNTDGNGVALQGYDPVSFFSEREPLLGKRNISSQYQGANYYFASAQTKATFDANPAQYVPQYGGFCAVSTAMGKLEPVEIDTWSIVNGRLYLQRNQKAVNMWKTKGPEFFISKANEMWPKLVEQYGSSLTYEQLSQGALTLEAAKVIAKSAAKYAQEHQAPGGAIAIVDNGGHLIYCERLTGTFPASGGIAIEKARSSAMFHLPTEKFEEAVNGGRVALVTNGYNSMKGGIPLYYRGQVVGAIGVSGAASADQDAEVAKAGAEAIFTPAQPNPPTEVTVIDANQVGEAFKKAAFVIKTNAYKVDANRRAPGSGLAEVHTDDTDIFHILKGTATFVVGGEVLEGKMISPGEIRGRSIQGGKAYDLKSGDIVIIPAGIPHWFKQIHEPLDNLVVKVSS